MSSGKILEVLVQSLLAFQTKETYENVLLSDFLFLFSGWNHQHDLWAWMHQEALISKHKQGILRLFPRWISNYKAAMVWWV